MNALRSLALRPSISIGYLAIVLFAKPLLACVRFDVPDTVSAVPVVETKALPHAEFELVRLDLDISAFVQFNHAEQLAQFLYVIELPERRVRIVDFSPKTELTTDITGTVSVSTQKESSSSLGLKATTSASNYATASANATTGGRESDLVKFERKPQLTLLAASGTLDRGYAVYFKLKPSTQTTLEGAKRFTLVLEVPKSWRTDFLRVRCAAYSVQRVSTTGAPICGAMTFLVGVHRQGDAEGFQLARQLIAAERRLRRMAASLEDQVPEEANTDVADLLLAVFRKSRKNPIPKNWVDEIVYDRSVSRTFPFERHLPDEVREAVSAFRLARQTLAHDGNHLPQT